MATNKLIFTLPDTPISLNSLASYGHGAAEKQRWAHDLCVYALQAGWQKMGRCKFKNCHVIMRFPDNRRRDEDNYRKVLKDALFYADLIFDDSVQKLNYNLKVEVNTGKRETEITLW